MGFNLQAEKLYYIKWFESAESDRGQTRAYIPEQVTNWLTSNLSCVAENLTYPGYLKPGAEASVVERLELLVSACNPASSPSFKSSSLYLQHKLELL